MTSVASLDLEYVEWFVYHVCLSNCKFSKVFAVCAIPAWAGIVLACGGEQGSFHRTRVQVTGPGRALYAIVFSCGFVACTEVNYQVSVSIQTLGARVRKISGALDAVWLWSRCSLRYRSV